jgi:hypothetical protein
LSPTDGSARAAGAIVAIAIAAAAAETAAANLVRPMLAAYGRAGADLISPRFHHATGGRSAIHPGLR